MKKIYAIRKGYKTGIVNTWTECEKNIKNYSGAEYKAFSTKEEAEAYLSCSIKKEHKYEPCNNSLLAYVDGSFSEEKQIYSYGCIMLYNGERRDTIYIGHG